MARPSTPHQGFIIPNAKDVVEPILAEPDKIDFNTVANARWGVLTGCLVTGNGGSSLSVSEGAAMVDGKFVPVEAVSGLSVTIPTGAPRFSLVVVNDNGVVGVLAGRESTDPVYPDPALNQTVLAAVYCKTGVSVADSVIDKRKFLPPGLLTKIDVTDDLIRNYNQVGALPSDPPLNFYRVLGSGETIWSNDTRVYRSATATLRVEDDLSVKRKISAGDDVSGLSITATENVTARNLRRSGSQPPDPSLGDLWQNPDTGSLYLCTKKGDGVTLEWDEVNTSNGTIPPGTIITSLVDRARMLPAGWLPLDGKMNVNEHDYPNLFKVTALVPYFSGVAPNRTMRLPDLTGRVMIGDAVNAGYMGPLVPGTQDQRANNNIRLGVQHMPTHNHASSAQSATVWQTRPAGAVNNLAVRVDSVTQVHSHANSDDGHTHWQHTGRLTSAGLDTGSVTGLSVFTPPAANRTGSPLNDAYAAVIVDPTSQTHTHLASVNDIPNHQHYIDVFDVGGGQAFDITPNYFTTFVYIKS